MEKALIPSIHALTQRGRVETGEIVDTPEIIQRCAAVYRFLRFEILAMYQRLILLALEDTDTIPVFHDSTVLLNQITEEIDKHYFIQFSNQPIRFAKRFDIIQRNFPETYTPDLIVNTIKLRNPFDADGLQQRHRAEAADRLRMLLGKSDFYIFSFNRHLDFPEPRTAAFSQFRCDEFLLINPVDLLPAASSGRFVDDQSGIEYERCDFGWRENSVFIIPTRVDVPSYYIPVAELKNFYATLLPKIQVYKNGKP